MHYPGRNHSAPRLFTQRLLRTNRSALEYSSVCAGQGCFRGVSAVAGRGPQSIDEEKASGRYRTACPLSAAVWLRSMSPTVVITWSRIATAEMLCVGQLSDLRRCPMVRLTDRLLHAAARLVRGGRRRTLKIAGAWPWADEIAAAWQRIHAIPHPT